MTHNKKLILGSIAAVAILTAAFVSCQPEKSAVQNSLTVPVETDSVASPVLNNPTVPKAIPCVRQEEAVQANPVSTAAIPVTEGLMEQENHVITVPVTEKMISLHRIDFSGVYWLPKDIKIDHVQAVLLNGKVARYSITENGNLDVWDAQIDSSVEVIYYE